MSDGRQLRKRRPQSAPVGPVGELIADATRRLSYSLRDAAKAINEAAKDVDGVTATFGPSTVHKWIHGVIPQPEARRWIAAGLDILLERLSEAAEAQQDRQRKSAPVGSAPTLPDFDSDDVITIPIPMANGGIAYVITRRAFMAGLATTASTLVAPTLAAPGAMQINNAHLVDELAAVTRGYASLFWTVSPTLMRPLLVNHYDLLTTNIGHSPSNRRHLLGLAAGTARLAGLAAYDDDDLGSARRLFVLGAKLAREAGDSALLGAILVAHRSVVSLTQHGDGGDRTAGVQAISLLDHAADAVGTTGPAMVNAMILCARAEEYAALKQADAALTDLDRAYAALAHTRSDTTAPPIGLLTTWDESRLDNYRASCLLYLDRATDAAELLEAQVIPIIPDHMAQPRCAALGNLASAYALGSEPEKSASIAIEALATARRVGLADGEKRIRRVRRQLEQWSDLAPVRELDERLVDSSSTIVPDEETP